MIHNVYEPEIRARLGTATHFCEVAGTFRGPAGTCWDLLKPVGLEMERLLGSTERDFFIDNLLVRIHFIIVMIRWTGLAPWKFEFPFPGSLTSTFPWAQHVSVMHAKSPIATRSSN